MIYIYTPWESETKLGFWSIHKFLLVNLFLQKAEAWLDYAIVFDESGVFTSFTAKGVGYKLLTVEDVACDEFPQVLWFALFVLLGPKNA